MGMRPAGLAAWYPPGFATLAYRGFARDGRAMVGFGICAPGSLLMVYFLAVNEEDCAEYYEAGYAVAKGKDLILCCKDGENPHFDVAQINTIFWKDEQSLKDKLVRRIRATIRVNE